jgi:hypothetical protein
VIKIRPLVLAAIGVLTWSKAEAALLTFTSDLTVAETSPSSGCTFNSAPCFGSATITVDTVTGDLSMAMTYTVGPAWNIHLDDGAPGTNGPTETYLRGDLAVACGTGTFCRNILMTDGFAIPLANLPDLIAGDDYLVITTVSTSQDGPGLIRGQLQAAPEPGSLGLMSLAIAASAFGFRAKKRRAVARG